MTVPKIVVHSDVLLDHICGNDHPSVLRLAMQKFFCYTTVYQAIELFALARTEREVQAIEHVMSSMKLLGLNPKNARKYGALISSNKKIELWNILIAGLCIESKLPIMTDRKDSFRGIENLVIVPTRLIQKEKSGVEILAAALA